MAIGEQGLGALSGLTLTLHRGADAPCSEDYRAWGLRQLQGELPFDSGIWADGRVENGAPEIHSAYLHNRPMQMLADYETVKSQDAFFQESVRNPRRAAAMEPLRMSLPEHVVAYLQKWKVWQVLTMLTSDPLTGLLTSIAIWRDNCDRPFSESERLFFEQVHPHLIESYAVSRIRQLVRAALPTNAESYSSAAVDASGCLQVVSSDFVQLLLDEWPDWRGPLLPADLKHLMETKGGPHVGRCIVAKSIQAGEAVLLQVRWKRPADELTARESEIAEGFARGMTAKQVARELGVSPETIRSHLAVIYKKLRVKNQTQMVWEVRGVRQYKVVQ